MDRHSAIGLTLISVLQMGYFYYTSQFEKPEEKTQPIVTTSPTTPGVAITPQEAITKNDSVLTATYGELSASFKGE